MAGGQHVILPPPCFDRCSGPNPCNLVTLYTYTNIGPIWSFHSFNICHLTYSLCPFSTFSIYFLPFFLTFLSDTGDRHSLQAHNFKTIRLSFSSYNLRGIVASRGSLDIREQSHHHLVVDQSLYSTTKGSVALDISLSMFRKLQRKVQ